MQPPDVGSTMLSWYLHMLTATTMSCLAVSPPLKHTILQHTKSVPYTRSYSDVAECAECSVGRSGSVVRRMNKVTLR